MKRYQQLYGMCEHLMPRHILEVGTHAGRSAVNMCAASPGAKYYGFDLFDAATAETDKEEMNGKRRVTEAEVRKLLTARKIDFRLFPGNTRQTLQEFAERSTVGIHLAFIDGGHSVETIASDAKWVMRRMVEGGVIVFDDYYAGNPAIDIDRFGCNRAVEKLTEAGWLVEILPQADPIREGGTTQLVAVVLVNLSEL